MFMELFRRSGRVLRDAVKLSYRTQLTFGAAGITYYLLISLIPLAMLLFIGLSVFGGAALAEYLLIEAEGFLTPAGYSVMEEILMETAGRSSATLLSVLFLVWVLYEMFHSIDIAMARIQGEPYQSTVPGLMKDIVTVLIMILGAAVILAAIEGMLAMILGRQFTTGLSVLSQFLLLNAVFLTLYYRFSYRNHRLGDLLPGAITAASGWMGMQLLFGAYISMKMQVIGTPVYDLFGGLLLFIIWLYLSTSLLLFGMAVNTVYRHPDPDAILGGETTSAPA